VSAPNASWAAGFSSGSNYHPNLKIAVHSRGILLKTSWVLDVDAVVVNEAHGSSAVWMSLITCNADDQLLAYRFVPEFRAGHLCLNNGLLVLQQEVHSRGAACIAGSPFLAPDVVKQSAQYCVKRILNVVFVLDHECGAVAVPPTDLPSNHVESSENRLQMQGGLGVRGAAGPFLRGFSSHDTLPSEPANASWG
jgi:hypothetical protein